MRSRNARLACGLLGGLLAAHLWAAEGLYRSVRLDSSGQLFIVLAHGGEVKAPKLADQVGFDSGLVAKDGKTVGWVALYPDPDGGEALAGGVVLYRNGRVARQFTTDQVIWSWQFADGDRDVVYCIGPTHGGAETCELHNVVTGHRVAVWDPKSRKAKPAWANGLRY